MRRSQDQDPYAKGRALTQRRLRLIWEMAQLGGSLSEEDECLVEVMQQHPEYHDLWGRLDELSDEEIERDGINPVVHVTIHQTIENQLAEDAPKEVRQVLEALMEQGLSRHEAIHRIGGVLSDEIFQIMKSQQPYDEVRYTRKLRRLVKRSGGKGRKRRRRRRRRRR